MTLTPWDPGLQNERTGLAWQRTMLAGLTCSVLVARLLASVSLILSIIIGLLALLCTAGLGYVAIRRFRLNNIAVHREKQLGDAKVACPDQLAGGADRLRRAVVRRRRLAGSLSPTCQTLRGL